MSELVPVFAALSDETRFAIVDRLLRDGDLPAGEISQAFDISAPAISRHLRVLRRAGLLEQTVSGTRRIYAVRPEAMKAVSDWIISHQAFWSGSLDRLEALLEEDTRS